MINSIWKKLEDRSPEEAATFVAVRLFVMASVLIALGIFYLVPNSNTLVSVGIACSFFCLMISFFNLSLSNKR